MADQEFTLVEAAKLEKPSVATGYIGIYANAYQTGFVAPVQPSDRQYNWRIEDDLPYTGSTGSRNIGSDFDATQANFKSYYSEVKAYGGKIKVDEYVMDNVPASVPAQKSSQVRAFARKLFIDTFQGTGGADLRGIRDWLGGDAASRSSALIAAGYENQVVNAGSTGSGDLITLDMLDEVLSKVEVIPGKTFIYCNEIITRKIKSLNRGNSTSGYNVVFSPSEIGRFDDVYYNVPIVTTKDGKNANLLDTDEFDATTNENTMSLYVVTWDVEGATYFSTSPTGVAGTPMPQIEEHGDGSNYKYHRFKFYPGFAPQKPRSIARLRGLKNSMS